MAKYPDIHVKLIGEDGNAYNLLGITKRALKKAGISDEEIKQFMDEAMSSDYNHLLRTIMDWVEVE